MVVRTTRCVTCANVAQRVVYSEHVTVCMQLTYSLDDFHVVRTAAADFDCDAIRTVGESGVLHFVLAVAKRHRRGLHGRLTFLSRNIHSKGGTC